MPCFSPTGDRFYENHIRKVDVGSIEKSINMMPKWSQNPSKIDEKSIQKSRSEKERPKIDKNRGLERPRVEKVAAGVQRVARF